jgi:hypothetical protein
MKYVIISFESGESVMFPCETMPHLRAIWAILDTMPEVERLPIWDTETSANSLWCEYQQTRWVYSSQTPSWIDD